MHLTRREFLRSGATGSTLFFFGAGSVLSQPTSTSPSPSNDRILVLLQMSGGNDGLSTIVPFGHDEYGRNRDRTRILDQEVIKLNYALGLHPQLIGLKHLYEDGKLAIVPGVGYPNPNRSHFKSMDIWHAADPRGRLLSQGWIGRLADIAFRGSDDPNLVVHIGNRVPFALQASVHRPIAFTAPEAYRWVGADKEIETLKRAACCEDENNPARNLPEKSSPHIGRDQALSRLRRTLLEAQASSELVREAAHRYRPRADYPPLPLAGSLATVSALISGGLTTRIYSVEMGGFDTHVRQRGSHDRLMHEVGGSLTAFLRDLAGQDTAKRVCVVAYSEFGRRLKENGSMGTDHGVAGPMFLLGDGVKGGIHGKHPSLINLDRGDLIHTIDFRRVYGAIIDSWIGAKHQEILGKQWKTVSVFT